MIQYPYNVSSVPAGSAAKAALVGANTVYGPAPESVSTSAAAFMAVTNVERLGVAEATPTILSDFCGDCVTCCVLLESSFLLLVDQTMPPANRAIAITPTINLSIYYS